jgi:HlyD family secretion protein
VRRKSIGIIVSALLVFACKGGGKKGEQYKTEKADRGDVTMTVTATGTIAAVTTVQVGSQVSGVIARLYADFNSHVTKGQLLAELDPTSFQAQVDQRKADVTKAQVEAANARITYDRQLRLVKAGLAAQADLDAARAAYEGSNAQVEQAKAALQQALTNLKYTKIISPIDGVVIDREYDVGQTVAASFQAPTLFQIAQDLTKMQVQADVDQSDIGRIAVGQPARFTVDSYPDQEFRGRISQIRLNATVSQNVVTYPVIIEVGNPEEKLRPKTTANVTIDVASVHEVLRVANAALRFKPDNADVGKPAGGQTGARQSGGSQSAGAEGTGSQGSGSPSAGAQGGTGSQGTGTQAAGGEGGGRRWGGRRRGGETGGGSTGGSPEQAMARLGDRQAGPAGAAAAFGGGRMTPPRRMQTVWILDPTTNKPKAVQIRTGITDGHYTEVVGGDLKVADAVIIGLATSKVEGPPPPGSSNPMGGRGGGGGGRGGRG